MGRVLPTYIAFLTFISFEIIVLSKGISLTHFFITFRKFLVRCLPHSPLLGFWSCGECKKYIKLPFDWCFDFSKRRGSVMRVG